MTELSVREKSRRLERWVGQLSGYLDPNDPSKAIRWLKGAFDRGVRFDTELPTPKVVAERIGRTYGKLSDSKLPREPPSRKSHNPDFAAWLIVLGLNTLVINPSMATYAAFVELAKAYLDE